MGLGERLTLMVINKTALDEQQFLTKAADLLSEYGEVSIESITDNLNPYSGRRVPDLVFIPESGPNKDVVHIIEFKTTSSEILPSVMVSNALQYKHSIEEANPNVRIRYALSSNGKVIANEGEREVTPLATVNDAKDLADKIVDWAGIKEETVLEAMATPAGAEIS